MTRLRALVEPTTTDNPIANLSAAIIEAKILRSIVDYTDNLRKIEKIPEAAKRAQFIRNELTRLESQLSQTRNQIINL